MFLLSVETLSEKAGHQQQNVAQPIDPQAEFFVRFRLAYKIYGCFSAKPYFSAVLWLD